jgi:histidine triad (HIT) family protein
MEDTVFHKIIRREIPAKIVRETEEYIVVEDIARQAPVHLLLIPKRTIPSLAHAQAGDAELLGKLLFAATELAREHGFSEDGYRVVINTGDNGGQTVNQLHLHLLAGRSLEWPPG